MKRMIVLCALVGCCTLALTSCTTVRQNLYDEGGDTAKRLADVMGRWQATTFDNALASANAGLQKWTEERGAYLVERTTDGTVEDPFPQRTLDWYDNVLASIRADIKFLSALKKRAEEAGAKPLPPVNTSRASGIENATVMALSDGSMWYVGTRDDGVVVVGKANG